MNNAKQLEIAVCMGSSCFVRGNNKNLEYIENLIESNNLNIKLELIGSRCQKQCAKGPNIIINGVFYNNVTKEDLKQIFLQYTKADV